MKISIKLFINILLAASCLVFAGCKESLIQNPETTQEITISGTIGDTAGRFASYSGKDAVFSVKAQKDSKVIDATVLGTSFYISLPEFGEWIFYAEGKDSNGITIFLGDKSYTIDSYRKHVEIAVTVKATSGNGSINLSIKDETKTISKVSIKLYSDNLREEIPDSSADNPHFNDFTFTNGICYLQQANIKAGTYNAELSFYKVDQSGENLVYRCLEVINIAPNLTTNTWYGKNSTYLNEKHGMCEFIITQEILDRFKR